MASKRAKYLVTTPAGKFLTSTLAEAKAVERAGGVPAKRKRNPAGGYLDFDAEFWAGEVMDDVARAIRENRPEWDWDPSSGKFYSEGPQLEVQLAANYDGSVSIYVSADELMHDTAPLQSKADVRKARTEAVKWVNSYFKRGNPAAAKYLAGWIAVTDRLPTAGEVNAGLFIAKDGKLTKPLPFRPAVKPWSDDDVSLPWDATHWRSRLKANPIGPAQAEAKAVERAGGVPPKRKRSAKRRRNPAPLAPGARVRVSSGCRARGVEKGDWGTVESIQELGADYGYSVKLTIQWSLGRGSRVWFVRHANRLGDLEISANDGNPSHKLRLERAPAGYGVAKHRNPTADEHERLAQSLTEAAQQWLYEAEAGQPGDLHTRMDYVTAFDFASRADEEAAHAPHFNDTNLSRVRSAARMGIERNPRKRRNGAVSQDAVLYVQHFDAKGRPHGKARKTTLAQFLVDHAADSDACDAARHLRVGDGVTLGGGGAPGLYVSRKGKKNPSAEEVGHAVGKYGAKGAAAVGRGLAAFGRGLWSASKGAVKGVQAAAAEAAAKREAAAKAAAEAQKAEAKLEQKVAALPAPAAPVANPAKRRKARR